MVISYSIVFNQGFEKKYHTNIHSIEVIVWKQSISKMPNYAYIEQCLYSPIALRFSFLLILVLTNPNFQDTQIK